jgi:hypothetical protein
MEKTTLTRLKIELESFKLLVTANLIGAAMTLAFTITFGFTEIIPIFTGIPLEPDQLPYLLVVISGFATAIIWITYSAELMEEHDEIVKDLDDIIERSKQRDSSEFDEEVTSVIVRSLAFYREKSQKINRLKWGGRITGTYLLITGIPQLISFVSGEYWVNDWYVLAQGFAVIASLGVSLAAWYVPVIIKRFMETWDARLSSVEDVNKKLDSILEGDE